ncbi:MAG: hypothetical protein ABWZ98_17030 [Nakamurella sp.]
MTGRPVGASHPKNVEVKVTIDGELVAAAAEAFDLDPARAAIRSIWFCESAAGLAAHRLDLLERGIILRLRAGTAESTDATVKLRSEDPPMLRPPWKDSFEIEGDWSGDRRMISASLTADVGAGVIESAVGKTAGLNDVFDGTQLRFLAEECNPPVVPAALRALGPVAALKWKAFDVSGLSADVRAEQWQVDELLFLEFSIRVKWNAAGKAQEDLLAVLAHRGIEPGDQQAPKTSVVLEHLAGIRS